MKYGEKKIGGYTDDGESVSMRVQRADARRCRELFTRSTWEEISLYWTEVRADKENGHKTRINYEEGQYAMYLRLPSKGEEAQKETEKVLRGNRIRDFGHRK